MNKPRRAYSGGPIPERADLTHYNYMNNRSNGRSQAGKGGLLAGFFFLLAAFMLMAGCTAHTDLQGQRDPKELYDKAMESYLAEHYDVAEQSFKRLMEDYPLSPYSVESQIMIADLCYATERYDDAGSYYTNFIALHPEHPKAAYALFQKGMSHFKEILSIDRDQTATKKALFAFEDLLASYPGCAYAPKAEELISFLRRRLAEREIYIAKFYFNSSNYKGALARLRDVLKNYPEVGLSDETLYYIGESYIRLGEQRLAEDAFTTLISDYPDSPYVKGARTRLKGS